MKKLYFRNLAFSLYPKGLTRGLVRKFAFLAFFVFIFSSNAKAQSNIIYFEDFRSYTSDVDIYGLSPASPVLDHYSYTIYYSHLTSIFLPGGDSIVAKNGAYASEIMSDAGSSMVVHLINQSAGRFTVGDSIFGFGSGFDGSAIIDSVRDNCAEGKWSATTGDNTVSPASKYYGISGITNGVPNASGNAVFLGQNVGTSSLSSWYAPDENLTGKGLSGASVWIPITAGKDITLSANYGRSSNMTSSSFINFQYELDDGTFLPHAWDVSVNLSGAFTPTSGTIYCKIPANIYTGIRLYISMANDGTPSNTSEYFWFDNVKIEQCGSSASNAVFTNTSLAFENTPSTCTVGCDSVTLRYTQTMPSSSTCSNRIESGSLMTVTVPSGYDATGCTGVLLTGTSGQIFSYMFTSGSYTATTTTVTFLMPIDILGGTDYSCFNASSIDGSTFKIYLYGIRLAGGVTTSGAVSAANYSGGTTSNSTGYVPPGYTCTTSASFSYNPNNNGAQWGWTLSNPDACGTSDYSFTQRINLTDCRGIVKSGTTFTVTLPAGASTSGSTVVSIILTNLTTGTYTATYTSSGNVVTITCPTLLTLDQAFVIKLTAITNPTATGTYTSSVFSGNQSGGTNSLSTYAPVISTSSCVTTNSTFISPALSLCNNLVCSPTYSAYTFTQGTTCASSGRINAGQTFTLTFPAGTDLSKATTVSYSGTPVTPIINSNVLTFITPLAIPSCTSTYSIIVSVVKNPTTTTTFTVTAAVPNSLGGAITGAYTATPAACPTSTTSFFGSTGLSLSTTAGCTKATYTWSQSVTSALASIKSGVTYTITFPTASPAVDLSSITTLPSGATFNGVAITSGWSVNTGTNTITFTTPTNVNYTCPTTAFTIVIPNITNPTAASTVTTGYTGGPNITGGIDSYSAYSFTTSACPTFSSPIISVCNNLVSTSTTYTFTQTTGSAVSEKINAGVTFTIVFPTGTTFGAVTGTYNGTAIGTYTVSGTTLTFPTPVAVNPGTTFSIVLNNIINPSSAGSWFISTAVPNLGGINTTSPANSYNYSTVANTSTPGTFTGTGLGLSTTACSTKATYTFTQTIPNTPTATIAAGAAVTITFASATLPNLNTITGITFNGAAVVPVGSWVIGGGGTTITFNAPVAVNNCPNASFAIAIAGITNPGVASTGTGSVSIVNNSTNTDSYSSPVSYSTASCACSPNGCTCPTKNSDGSCATCTSSLSGCTYDPTSYAAAGYPSLTGTQTLCITSGTYAGAINFNGGKVVVGSGATFNPTNTPINITLNSGTIEVQSGGTANIHGINAIISTVTVNNCGTINFDGDIRATIATINLNNNGTMTSTRDLNLIIAGSFCNGKGATATFRNMDAVIANSAFVNNGTLTFTGNLTQIIANTTVCSGSTLKVLGNWNITIGDVKGPGSNPSACGGIQVKGTSTCIICSVTGYLDFCDSSALGLGTKPFDNSAIPTVGSSVTNCTCTPTVLPITLVNFSATPEDNTRVKVEWTTAAEINNDYFTIERSADGYDFELVAIVKGAGNSTEDLSYSIYDENPIAGTSYYRLSQTDYDHKKVVYPPVAVQVNKTGLYVYPNPVVSNLQFFINSTSSSVENVSIEIVDVSGKQVFTKEEHLVNGTNAFHYDVNYIAAGIYFLKVSTRDGIIFDRFLK